MCVCVCALNKDQRKQFSTAWLSILHHEHTLLACSLRGLNRSAGALIRWFKSAMPISEEFFAKVWATNSRALGFLIWLERQSSAPVDMNGLLSFALHDQARRSLQPDEDEEDERAPAQKVQLPKGKNVGQNPPATSRPMASTSKAHGPVGWSCQHSPNDH